MSEGLEVGDVVRWQKRPGCRIFTATVVRVRSDGTVDVVDPRNGGLRTLEPEKVRAAR